MLFSFEGSTSWLPSGISELLALSLFRISSPMKRYIRVRSQTKDLCLHGAWGAAWRAHRSILVPHCGSAPKKAPPRDLCTYWSLICLLDIYIAASLQKSLPQWGLKEPPGSLAPTATTSSNIFLSCPRYTYHHVKLSRFFLFLRCFKNYCGDVIQITQPLPFKSVQFNGFYYVV